MSTRQGRSPFTVAAPAPLTDSGSDGDQQNSLGPEGDATDHPVEPVGDPTVPTRRTVFALGASATYRRRPSENQDRIVVLDQFADGVTGVVVADGIGAWPRSGSAAEAAVRAAAETLRNGGAASLRNAFTNAHEAVMALAPNDPMSGDHAGTTLLVAVLPAPGRLSAAWVGNGAILEAVPTDGAKGISHRVNHVVPHIGFQNGREVLTRSLSTTLVEEPTPSVIHLERDGPAAFVVVTDGAFSEEHYWDLRGEDASGDVWVRQPVVLERVLSRALEVLDASVNGEFADVTGLEAELVSLAAEGLLEDDTTVGVVVT